MVNVFNKVILDIVHFFIPHKDVKIDDKDSPWVTPEVKSVLRRNARKYKKWVKNGRDASTKHIISQLQIETNKIIEKAKAAYTNKLCKNITDQNNGPKVFFGLRINDY